MAKKTQILWTLLPRYADGAYLYATFFVSPRLDPGGAGGKLSDFALGNWPALLKKAALSLTPGAAFALKAEVVPDGYDQPDPSLWALAFPGDTPVGPFSVRDLSKRKLTSFGVKQLASALGSLYDRALLDTDGEPPDLADPASPIADLVSTIDFVRKSEKELASKTDEQIAAYLEAHLGPDKGPLAFELYRVKRFYERSERDDYAPRDDSKTRPFLEPPRLEFHEAIAQLGDHPSLLRKLGLAVDVRVDRKAVGDGDLDLSCHALWELDPGIEHITPPTLCRLAGSLFTARSAGPTDAVDGWLALGDPKLFSLVADDLDGEAMKAWAAALSLANLKKKAGATVGPEGLPSRRSAGVRAIRSGRADSVGQHLAHIAQIATAPGQAKLSADDLRRGYRVDVEVDGAWRSLCRRTGEIVVSGQAVKPGEADREGYVKASSASGPPQPSATDRLYLHEAVFGWEGYSLAAPRPGRSLTFARNDAQHTLEQRVAFVPNLPGAGFEIAASYRAEPGSLPRLRFGKSYRMRARVADLAGNSLPPGAKPPSDLCVSPHVTYLRHEPIAAPALVAEAPMKDGESLERLAIRSDVDATAAEYAARAPSAKRGFLAECRRHVLPPKAAQALAEQHGALDGLDAKSAYFVSLKERGSLFDRAIVDVKTGEAKPLPSGTVRLGAGPDEPEPTEADFPAHPGDPPREGQYVYYPGKSIDLPYLPDPASGGFVLRGLPSGEATVEWAGGFPLVESAQITVTDAKGQQVEVEQGEGGLRIGLPKASIVKLRYASVPAKSEREKMAVFRALVEKAPSPLRDKAAMGGHVMLTPSRELWLVHAVQRPLEASSFDKLAEAREPGQTFATLSGRLKVHGRSAGSIEVVASWQDPVDRLSDHEGPKTEEHRGLAFRIDAHYHDQAIDLPAGLRHELGDTKHRRVRYRPDATSRYREYMAPEVRADAGALVTPGLEAELSLPSTARPEAPKVAYVVPTFRWETPDGKTQKRVGRGLRVYLERPWFSSGEGELLGVMILPPDTSLASLGRYVSERGGDPIWAGGSAGGQLSEDDFVSAERVVQKKVPLAEDGSLTATVVGLPVEYHADRRMWFCDVELAETGAYTPFVRLALVRFQPDSVEGVWVSRVVRADFAQVLPDRTASVTFGSGAATVVVSGPWAGNASAQLGYAELGPQAPSPGEVTVDKLSPEHESGRQLEAEVQRRPAGSDEVIGWSKVGEPTPLHAYASLLDGHVYFKAQLPLPAAEGGHVYRVLVREREILLTDPDVGEGQAVHTGSATWKYGRRVVFLCAFPFP